MRQEENFAVLYGSTGRPNYSVGRMVEADPEMTLMRGVFEMVSLKAISKLGINVTEQRHSIQHSHKRHAATL